MDGQMDRQTSRNMEGQTDGPFIFSSSNVAVFQEMLRVLLLAVAG